MPRLLPLCAVALALAGPGTAHAEDGAPRIGDAAGWSIKPRGRMQLDLGSVDAPETGTGTEVRRAYLGVDGTMPGGWGYRAEVDLANSSAEIVDLYLTYKPDPKLTLTLGQHKPFWGLEELTSDLMTSFTERAAFNPAFGFERRVGFSAAYADGPLLMQGGVFADNAADLGADNSSHGFDGRVVLAPRLGAGQLHLGLSGHWRKFDEAARTARYRARPFVHTTDTRLVDTGSFAATGEQSLGAELAWVAGRFHATAETHRLTARRPGLPDPTFSGGYAELGWLLTDDATAYKGGVYDRIRPRRPLGQGGAGAVQANLRYDWLDLNDAGVTGGRQQVAGVSLVWIPAAYVRFIVNYGHLWLTDAPLRAGRRSYQANALGVRAQFDF